MPNGQITHRFAIPAWPGGNLYGSTHGEQHIQQPGACGIQTYVLQGDLRTRGDHSGHNQESGRRKIPRKRHRQWFQRITGCRGNQVGLILGRTVCGCFLAVDGDSHACQHSFGMVARETGFDDSHRLSGRQTGQQQAGFYLGAGHRGVNDAAF